MRKGKFESAPRPRRKGSKAAALILAAGLLVGGVVGGTVAWLTAQSGPVNNTFTPSNIKIELDETKKDFKMNPGWTIDKDPKVTVVDDSEDCWLFVKIVESTTPDLDKYIAYATETGWEAVDGTAADNDNDGDNDVIVIGRKVYKDDSTKTFSILGAGNYTLNNDTPDTSDDVTVSWGVDEVGVKPEVTEEMMEDLAEENQPTLTFTAYAVQLYKTNSDNDKSNTDDEFTITEAWAQASGK